MNAHKEWMAQISEIDEFFGKKPTYSHTLLQSYIQNELNKQNEVIRSSNSEVSDSILSTTLNICGTLEQGFGLMVETNRKGFDQIDNSLQSIDSTLNWGFSKLIELNRQKNVLLNDIIVLLNIPDIEKQRKSNIEKGLEFFKKSKIDSSFIIDAKGYFDKALALENTDYFVLYNLGLIHLFSKEFLDFSLAKEYFLKSGKYSNADISFKSSEYTIHKSSFENQINPKTIATYSYLYASRCEYFLKKYENALILAEKSYALTPNIVEVVYDMSKYFAINNEINKSIIFLKKAIDLDRFITLKLLKDFDLIKHTEIIFFTEKIKSNALNQGNNLLNACKSLIASNSNFKNDLEKAELFLSNETFLDSMSALDILNP